MVRRRISLALALVVVAWPAAADTVVTVKSHTDAVSKRQSAEDRTQTTWLGDDAIRYDDGAMTSIVRLDRKKMYLVDHDQRTVMEMDIPFDYKAAMGAAAPMMEKMFEMMQPTIEITPTDRTGTYAGYDCKFIRAEISMAMARMTTTVDNCLSDEVPVDLTRYTAYVKALADATPASKWMKELMETHKGYPVRTETTAVVGGKTVKSWQELEKVEEKSAPAGQYDPPANYKKTEFNPMAQMQQGKNR